MRIIDLLNKIANGEDVPKKIKYKDIEFTYIQTNRKALKYVSEKIKDCYSSIRHLFWYIEGFDDEVEIIEEDNKIEKLKISDYEETFSQFELDVVSRINKILDEVNKLKGENK